MGSYDRKNGLFSSKKIIVKIDKAHKKGQEHKHQQRKSVEADTVICLQLLFALVH